MCFGGKGFLWPAVVVRGEDGVSDLKRLGNGKERGTLIYSLKG